MLVTDNSESTKPRKVMVWGICMVVVWSITILGVFLHIFSLIRGVLISLIVFALLPLIGTFVSRKYYKERIFFTNQLKETEKEKIKKKLGIT